MRITGFTTFRSKRFFILHLILLFTLHACSSYSNKVTPVPLPEEQAGSVKIDEVTLYAEAYLQHDAAEDAFGFDIRGAGVLPVRFVLDNQSSTSIEIRGDQTFLIDSQKQLWPLLSHAQASRRISEHVKLTETTKGAAKPAIFLAATGALVGAAIGTVSDDSVGEAAVEGAAVGAAAGAVTGGTERYQQVGENIREDLEHNAFDAESVASGDIAHGYLFFPGDHEITSIDTLRISIRIDNRFRIVNLQLNEKK